MWTREAFQKFAPRPKGPKGEIWDGYVNALINDGPDLFEQHGIDLAAELNHFLAQIAHETGGFTILWEDMNYRASRIMEIFGVGNHSAAVTEDEAKQLAGNPEALAERVYGLGNPRKAIELGNTAPGEGYRYRGFGPNQLTGKRDHLRLLNGDYSYTGALRGSLIEFEEKGCLELAVKGDVKAITKRINGGYNGLADRRACLVRAKSVWPEFPIALEHLPPLPANDTAPSPAPLPPEQRTMLTSKEGNAQVVQGTLGGGLALTDAQTVAVGVVQKSIASGKPISLMEIVLAVVQSPLFMVGATVVISATCSWLWRARKRWHRGI